ncbi:MAG: hypothetical protein ACK5H0_00445 [Bacteroidota bacterium]
MAALDVVRDRNHIKVRVNGDRSLTMNGNRLRARIRTLLPVEIAGADRVASVAADLVVSVAADRVASVVADLVVSVAADLVVSVVADLAMTVAEDRVMTANVMTVAVARVMIDAPDRVMTDEPAHVMTDVPAHVTTAAEAHETIAAEAHVMTAVEADPVHPVEKGALVVPSLVMNASPFPMSHRHFADDLVVDVAGEARHHVVVVVRGRARGVDRADAVRVAAQVLERQHRDAGIKRSAGRRPTFPTHSFTVRISTRQSQQRGRCAADETNLPVVRSKASRRTQRNFNVNIRRPSS